jgi:hypothetical protein
MEVRGSSSALTGNVALDVVSTAEAERLLDARTAPQKNVMSSSEVNELLAELRYIDAPYLPDWARHHDREPTGPLDSRDLRRGPPAWDDLDGYQDEYDDGVDVEGTSLKNIEKALASIDDNVLCLRDDFKTRNNEDVLERLDSLETLQTVYLDEIRSLKQEIKNLHGLLETVLTRMADAGFTGQ